MKKRFISVVMAMIMLVSFITSAACGKETSSENAEGTEMADEILITDELAGHGNVMEFRKPNDLPFLIMRKRLEIPCRNMAFVGDDIEKDFIAPKALGMECYWKKNEDGLYE